jgi:ATP-dependent RNA helicase DDX49/DBP8
VAVTVVTERDVELVQRIEKDIGVSMTEMELPEEEVLEALNAVSLARRMATMVSPVTIANDEEALTSEEMHDSGFGERQATNKAKAIKRAKRDAVTESA